MGKNPRFLYFPSPVGAGNFFYFSQAGSRSFVLNSQIFGASFSWFFPALCVPLSQTRTDPKFPPVLYRIHFLLFLSFIGIKALEKNLELWNFPAFCSPWVGIPGKGFGVVRPQPKKSGKVPQHLGRMLQNPGKMTQNPGKWLRGH